MKQKMLILLIVIIAVSVIGAVVLHALLANNGIPFSGTMVFESDVTGVTVTILGPEETLKTGLIGENGQVTFTGLPEGNYQAIATKDGYTAHYVAGTSINPAFMGGMTTVPIYMMEIPDELPVYAISNPNAVIINQGSSKTVTVTVTSMNNFAGEVSLDIMQLPAGVTATLNPESVTLTAGGKASSTLTLTVSTTATEGIYPLDVDLATEQLSTGGLGLLLQVS
jgi:hypothetical protein